MIRARNFIFALLLCFIPAAAMAGDGPTREITDMAGRKVVIPALVKKVYTSSPPVTYLLYATAPDMLAGWSFPLRDEDKRFLRPETITLPVFGGSMGQGRQVNMEEVLAARPDFVLAWINQNVEFNKVEARFAKVGLPVVFVRLDTLSDYPTTLRFLGDLLGRQQRTDDLAKYIETAQSRVAAAVQGIPSEQRVKVFYAESPDGLATECHTSFHIEPLRIAGGENVHHCEQSSHYGMEKISLEQIIAYQPALILSQERGFAAIATANPNWRNVPAVKAGRIVTIPRAPFNWVDRPPSFMRALGIQWLANLLYPDRYPLDIRAETKAFYQLFLGVELSAADLDTIVN